MSEAKKRVEFGDFQTPFDASVRVCEVLKELGLAPKVVIEPTCGRGSFLVASIQTFGSTLVKAMGFDINSTHIEVAEKIISEANAKLDKPIAICVEKKSFFDQDWGALLRNLPEPVLFIGNPPWVTNSVLGQLESANLPTKGNSFGLKGLDAITGKSNFDISEWMLIRMLEAIQGTSNSVAMLCKTSVARKLLKFAQYKDLYFSDAKLHYIDSKNIFNVAVDACLFSFGALSRCTEYSCRVFGTIDSNQVRNSFGYVNRKLVANIESYKKTQYIEGQSQIQWRSGLKHDCSPVMELRISDGALKNGLQEEVQIEADYLFPLLKSSDLTKCPLPAGNKFVIVTQKKVGEDTLPLQASANKLWHYLSQHEGAFSARKSSIYRNKPPFSIFGVGPYSFSKWKVAISGLYKQSKFTVVGPSCDKPAMLDDTCYFLPFDTEDEAVRCQQYLNSKGVQEFLESIIFWDAKRPISAEILERIDLSFLQVNSKYRRKNNNSMPKSQMQLNL